MQNQELQQEVDVKETCDSITVEGFSIYGEYDVEKEGCEVSAYVNGGHAVETEAAGHDFADEFHRPDEVHGPDAADKDCELTVDVNGACVAKTKAGEIADEVSSPDVVGPDSSKKNCELILDVNGGCVLETQAGGAVDEAHSPDVGPDAAKEVCEVTVDVDGGCAVAKEESDLNAHARSHGTDPDVKEKECDVDGAAVNGGCLAGEEKRDFTADQELGQKVEDIERRIGHYTNRQKILLVGEGDFSFAACLAKSFGRATNITATSLDDRASVISKYSKGEKNLQSLKDYGAIVIHRVDAHTMNRHPDLETNLYHRIVFNFPHYGGMYGGEHHASFIERHQKVVAGFFKAAKYMVGVKGEIHVTHKTASPFDRWNIEELAEEAGLVLQRKADFCRWDYPGYENKKAYGLWPDSTFPVGRCSTFMFSTG